MLFFSTISVACRLPGPSERLLRDAYQCVAVGGGWRGGMGGFRGRNRGMGGGFRERNRGIGGAGIGVRETGIRNPQESGIRGIRKPETVSELTGVHICARNRGIRRNSPPETPRKRLRKPPENPRISK